MAAPPAPKNGVDTRTGVSPPKLDDVSEIDKLEKRLKAPLQSLRLWHASHAPVPNKTGDGSQLKEEDDRNAIIKAVENGLKDWAYLGITDVKTLIEVQTNKLTGELTDDKTYLMEAIIRTAQKLPDGSAFRKTLTDQLISGLWNDLEHPPVSYLGAKYQYRSADGSFNSLIHPQLGAAGTPYARTVKPSIMQTPALPDPGVVFDSVMTRKHREKHPNRISSMLFYLASIIIHDLFRTDHVDYSNSLTSSYLDLSPLYGSNQAEQDLMRTGVDGKIKPDCFSEARLLLFPPGVGCLLIMFNRFHNDVVEKLTAINEGGRFTKPVDPKSEDEKLKQKYKAQLVKYDNDLFQTGRLITCGLYVNVILIDYVRTILDLNRTDSNWQLNPRAEIKDLPLGTGNQVSAEFNLVYRWHSTVSDRDEKWTQSLWNEIIGPRDPKTVDGREFIRLMGVKNSKISADPAKRDFMGLKRDEDGSLPDQPLFEELIASVKDCANSFGPNRVPAVMRAIEVLGIEQSRAWNLGSLNEFRKYFGLEPHSSFEDITSDPYVAEQLKHLYDTPDKVELYPGLVVEDAKKPMAPGSGLAPPYTTSRAVLSDAVALVRGDRFYTLDYNPRTLTNWGYRTAEGDLDIDNGCVFYKLFLNAFPEQFKSNSVFVHYPLTIPSAMREALEHPYVDKAHLYDFEEPRFISQNAGDKAAAPALNGGLGPWNTTLSLLGQKPGHGMSKPAELALHKALYPEKWEREVRSFYAQKTRELVLEKSAKIADFHQVDIIRDVGNLVGVHFVSEMFMLPLKTDEKPRGVFTEADMYHTLASLAVLAEGSGDRAQAFALQVTSYGPLKDLRKMIEGNVSSIRRTGILSAAAHLFWHDDSPLKSYGKHAVERLLHVDHDGELVSTLILGSAASIVAHWGQLFAQAIEFFLTQGTQFWPKIQELSKQETDVAFETLTRYVMEGSRLYNESKLPDGLFHGSSDSEVLDFTRQLKDYKSFSAGPLGSTGAPMARVALTAMLKEVAKLKNFRAAKGPQGRVHKIQVTHGVGKGSQRYLREMWDSTWEFPCALKVNWDD